ncbi:MAG: VanZ family protein [Gemmatimonadota bacterium]
MTRLARPLVFLMALGWVGFLAYLTLTPGLASPPLSLRRFFCIVCTHAGTADLIRNWILFLPGGFAFALLYGKRRAVLMCAVLTLMIETAQVWLPGRDPVFHDLALNALGGWTGAQLVTAGWRGWVRWSVAGTAAAAWLVPALLLIPLSPHQTLYGLWTPRLGGMDSYEGQVLDARVGPVSVPTGRVRDDDRVREAIANRETVTVTFTPGPTPTWYAPIFMVSTGRQVGLLMIATRGDDIHVHGHNVARRLRLDQPAALAFGALADLPQDTPVTLTLERDRDSGCVTVDTVEHCRMAPSLADGWSFVLDLTSASAGLRAFLRAWWTVCLGLGIGLAVGGLGGVGLATLVTALGLVISTVSPDVRPDLLNSAVLMLTTGAACALRPWVLDAREFIREATQRTAATK